MRFGIFLTILLFMINPLCAKDYVLFDSAESDISWQIIPDGYINTEDGDNSKITTVNSARYGNVLGISLEFSDVNTLSYYILKPDKEIHLPELTLLENFTITIFGNQSNLDAALLVEDNSGIEYEFFLDTIDFSELNTIITHMFKNIDGVKFTGIVIYNNIEREPLINSRVIYIKEITLRGYTQ